MVLRASIQASHSRHAHTVHTSAEIIKANLQALIYHGAVDSFPQPRGPHTGVLLPRGPTHGRPSSTGPDWACQTHYYNVLETIKTEPKLLSCIRTIYQDLYIHTRELTL